MSTLSRGGFVRVPVNVDRIGLRRVRGVGRPRLVGMRTAGVVVPVVTAVPVWWRHGGSASTLTNANANMSDANVDSGQHRYNGRTCTHPRKITRNPRKSCRTPSSSAGLTVQGTSGRRWNHEVAPRGCEGGPAVRMADRAAATCAGVWKCASTGYRDGASPSGGTEAIGAT